MKYINNNEIEYSLHRIIHDITHDGFKPDYIVGIARGGLIPAIYLSHWYDVPLIQVQISLRDKKVHEEQQQLPKNKNILIVDDICDQGETLKNVLEMFNENNVKSAVLVNNIGQSTFDVDYYGFEINKQEDPSWIVFPWENWWEPKN